MQKRNALVIAALLILAGCAVPTLDGDAPNYMGSVPEVVAAIAAPGQDLTSARLLPDDGCYWYEHRGPVETTLVPLRSEGGNPICTSR